MSKRRHPRADHVADTRRDGWIGLPKVVADSPAFLALSPFDRAVFMEILREFNGFNNGEIAITYEKIGVRLKGQNKALPNNGRIARAIVRLVEHGLLGEPTPGSWLQRLSREYRLTFISSGKAPPFQRATNDYLHWTPREKITGDARSPEKRSGSYAQSPGLLFTGDARSPVGSENGSFARDLVLLAGDAASLLIESHTGMAEAGFGWWGADAVLTTRTNLMLAILACLTAGPMKKAA
jgi:hypothetical protein